MTIFLFVKIFRRIFTQNWILDPEIDSTQRAQQNAHLIDRKGQQKYRQILFLKNLDEIGKFIFRANFRVIEAYCIIIFKTSFIRNIFWK